MNIGKTPISGKPHVLSSSLVT